MAIYKKMIKNIEKNIFYRLHIQSSNKIGYLSLFELSSKTSKMPAHSKTAIGDRDFTPAQGNVIGPMTYLLNGLKGYNPKAVELLAQAMTTGVVLFRDCETLLSIATAFINALMVGHDLADETDAEAANFTVGSINFQSVKTDTHGYALFYMKKMNNLHRRLSDFKEAKTTSKMTLLKWEELVAEKVRMEAAKPKEFKPAASPKVNAWKTNHALKQEAEKLSETSSVASGPLPSFDDEEASTSTASTAETEDFQPVMTGKTNRRAYRQAKSVMETKATQLPYRVLGAVKAKHEVNGVLPSWVFASACKQWTKSLAEGFKRFSNQQDAVHFAHSHCCEKLDCIQFLRME